MEKVILNFKIISLKDVTEYRQEPYEYNVSKYFDYNMNLIDVIYNLYYEYSFVKREKPIYYIDNLNEKLWCEFFDETI